MRVSSFVMPDGHKIWNVICDNGDVIAPILQYLTYLYNLQRSPNTLRAYAYHLKHFWEYLAESGFDWKTNEPPRGKPRAGVSKEAQLGY